MRLALLCLFILGSGYNLYAQRDEGGGYCVTNLSDSCSTNGCQINTTFIYCDAGNCLQEPQCHTASAAIQPGTSHCFTLDPCGTPTLVQVKLRINNINYVVDADDPLIEVPHCTDPDMVLSVAFSDTGTIIREKRAPYCLENRTNCTYRILFQYCDDPICTKGAPKCYERTANLHPGEKICFEQPCCRPLDRTVFITGPGIDGSLMFDQNGSHVSEGCNPGVLSRFESRDNDLIISEDIFQ